MRAAATTEQTAETIRDAVGDTSTTCVIRIRRLRCAFMRTIVSRTGDQTPTVIASTASPFKFCRSVIESLGGTLEKDDVSQLAVLTELTGCCCTLRRLLRWRTNSRALTAWWTRRKSCPRSSLLQGSVSMALYTLADLHLATGVAKADGYFRRTMAGIYGKNH